MKSMASLSQHLDSNPRFRGHTHFGLKKKRQEGNAQEVRQKA